MLAVYGAIDVIDLQPGETVTIDTGHVVAYDLGMNFNMRRAVQGRTIQSMKSGEGFVFDFTGPGRVLAQTRNPPARSLRGSRRSPPRADHRSHQCSVPAVFSPSGFQLQQ